MNEIKTELNAKLSFIWKKSLIKIPFISPNVRIQDIFAQLEIINISFECTIYGMAYT